MGEADGDEVSHGREGPSDDPKLHELFEALSLQVAPSQKREAKKHYAFWSSQPVAQFDDDPESAPVSIADPTGLWCSCVRYSGILCTLSLWTGLIPDIRASVAVDS